MPRTLKHSFFVGQRFGRITITEYKGLGMWLCRCDCGADTTVRGSKLHTGHTRSCGCFRADRSREHIISYTRSSTRMRNRVEDNGEVARIYLQNGQCALVDSADLPSVRAVNLTWQVINYGYVACRSKNPRRYVLLHHVVVQPREGFVLDHINGNRLDNRRCNLRSVVQQVNALNRNGPVKARSGYRCVYPFGNKWKASIKINGRPVHLGVFEDPRAASLVVEASRTKVIKSLMGKGV